MSPQGPRPDRVLGVLLVGPFMAQADATITNVATPSIQSDLGASGAELELVVGAYLIAFAALLVTGARLGQTHGYRRILLLGVGLFTGASLLCGLALDPTSLIFARALQGIGAALMFPQSLTGIQLNLTGGLRTRAIGRYAMALSGGAVAGQILGGALVFADIAGSGWRSIFLVNVPVGIVLVIAAFRHLPADTPKERRRLDLGGVATLSASMLLVVSPLVLGREAGWPPWTWLSLGAGALVITGFLAVERSVAARGGSPLVNLALLAEPAVRWALLTLLVATATYYALLFCMAQYLQRGLGHGPLLAGLTLVPWVAAFGLASQVVRRLPSRWARSAPGIGCSLLALAYAAISATMFTDPDGPLLYGLLGVGGLGLGIQFNALITHLTTVAPAEHAPEVSGVTTTVLQIGGALGVAALGSLYLSADAHLEAGSPSHAFGVATAAFAAVALVAVVTASGATHAATSSMPPGPAKMAPGTDLNAVLTRNDVTQAASCRESVDVVRDDAVTTPEHLLRPRR
ncbi:MAG: MFS transporter [Micromonosporaceae bacterium]